MTKLWSDEILGGSLIGAKNGEAVIMRNGFKNSVMTSEIDVRNGG